MTRLLSLFVLRWLAGRLGWTKHAFSLILFSWPPSLSAQQLQQSSSINSHQDTRDFQDHLHTLRELDDVYDRSLRLQQRCLLH